MFKLLRLSTVGEGEAAGEKHGFRLFGPGAVLVVPHPGEAPAGELDPDLVAAAGVETDAHKALFPGGEAHKFQPGFLDTGALPFHHENLVFSAVFP